MGKTAVGALHDQGGEGHGWSGVTPQQKDQAAGRDRLDVTVDDRFLTAGKNTELVALRRGSGHWTRRSPFHAYDPS